MERWERRIVEGVEILAPRNILLTSRDSAGDVIVHRLQLCFFRTHARLIINSMGLFQASRQIRAPLQL